MLGEIRIGIPTHIASILLIDKIKKYNKKINRENIDKAPLILPHAQASTRKKLDEFLANRQIKLNPVMEIASTEIILKIIKENIGIRMDIKRFDKRRRGII